MADIKYYDVILKPVITEKSMNGMADKEYTFLVHPEANKSQIKEAVEKMFDGAKVMRVNTINCLGKNKRRGMVTGKVRHLRISEFCPEEPRGGFSEWCRLRFKYAA